ncbi:MAG: DUF2079 domain-containing protein [Nitrospinales bacterium]
MDINKNSICCRCIVVSLVLLVLGGLVWLSIMRYYAYNAEGDLRNMSQAVWSATQGEPLVFTSTHGPLSRLAVHVELFYFLLTPLYMIFSSPVMLLVFQAMLFVAGAFPLYKLAARRFESCWMSLVIVGIYLFYPVAQTAVLFDFHGDTLAMPLLVFVIEAQDRRAWGWYWFWLLLALSCKFYVAISIAALGGVLWMQGRRHVGVMTTIAGIGWGFIAYFVIRPLFAPPVGTGIESASAGGYLAFYFGQIFESIGTTWFSRAAVALVVFFPVIWVGWYAPAWLIPAASIAVPALLSSGPGPSYHFVFHHYALVVPFLMAVVIYGIDGMRKHQEGLRKEGKRNFAMWPLALYATLVSTLVLNSFFVHGPLNLSFWDSVNGMRVNSMKYGRTARDAVKDEWLASNVPSRTPLASSKFLVPHLVNRHTLYETDYFYDYVDEVDCVVPDALFDYVRTIGNGNFVGGATHDWPVIKWMLQRPDFGLIASKDGLLLFQRNASPEQILRQHVEIIPVDALPELQANFGDFIGIVNSNVKMLSKRRFLLTYNWLAMQSLKDLPVLFAVSRMQGVDQARIVHLPTLALAPTSTWKPRSLIREEFEIVLPSDLAAGSYPLWVGWYYSSSIYAFATDDRSRVSPEIMIQEIKVP